MISNKQLILETTRNLIGLKARNVRCGYGSFLTMGFGNDIEYLITIRRVVKTEVWPEWYLWIYLGNWELHADESGIDIITSSNDQSDIIEKKLRC